MQKIMSVLLIGISVNRHTVRNYKVLSHSVKNYNVFFDNFFEKILAFKNYQNDIRMDI